MQGRGGQEDVGQDDEQRGNEQGDDGQEMMDKGDEENGN